MDVEQLSNLISQHNLRARSNEGRPPLVIIQTGTDADGEPETMALGEIRLVVRQREGAGTESYLLLVPDE